MGDSSLYRRGHIVSMNIPVWGHTKAACALLQKIVRQQTIYVTLYTAAPLFEQVVKELDSQFLPDVEDNLRKLIRVIPLETSPNPFDLTLLNENFAKEYQRLLNTESGNEIEPGPPQLVLIDFFLYATFVKIRELTGHTVPIYGIVSGSITTGMMFFGPGGRFPNLVEELEAIPKTDEAFYVAEAVKIYARTNGRIMNIPGLPPLYDHELMPQKPILTEYIVFMLSHVLKFFRECDGAVINSTHLFEGEAIKAFEKWFGGRPSFYPGPFDYPVIKQERVRDREPVEFERFLDSILEKFGSNSLVYVSLGSQHWPAQPEKLWAIIDTLIERQVPFMFSRGSPFATVPDEIEEKIQSCGFGYSSKWLPQVTILKHEACGWMLTHAGQNSVSEALSAGIPMICWPFDADQPLNAVNISSVHNVGYELFEVREGVGLGPVHRLGGRKFEGTVEAVKREFSEKLEKMNGEDGAVKRANARKLQSGFAKLWAPGGENWQGIKGITDATCGIKN